MFPVVAIIGAVWIGRAIQLSVTKHPGDHAADPKTGKIPFKRALFWPVALVTGFSK